MKIHVARTLGQLESEVYAGCMSAGDAIETLVQTTDLDADELDIAREKLHQSADEANSDGQES